MATASGLLHHSPDLLQGLFLLWAAQSRQPSVLPGVWITAASLAQRNLAGIDCILLIREKDVSCSDCFSHWREYPGKLLTPGPQNFAEVTLTGVLSHRLECVFFTKAPGYQPPLPCPLSQHGSIGVGVHGMACEIARSLWITP